jgi:PAS domain-containing protein
MAAPGSREEKGPDPLLPQVAVCDRHQDRPAHDLVVAPDGRGDCYLCGECFQAHLAGGQLPFLRHSPTIRRRPTAHPPSRRRGAASKPARGAAQAEEDAALLRSLFAHADVSLVLFDETGTILAAVGPDGGVLGHTGRPRSGILDHVHPDDLSLAYELLAEVGATPGKEVSFEIRAFHADGSIRTLAMLAVNRLDDPLLRGLVIRSRDVTGKTL